MINVQDIIDQVEKGLPEGVRDRMNRAAAALAHYNLDSERLPLEYVREAETVWDLKRRPFVETGLMHELVNVLTDHLYAPGPSRTWDGAAGDEFLQQVYRDNHVDAIWLGADILSHATDAAAIQVDAAQGTATDQPITLRVWGADEFHCWFDEDDVKTPQAVITKDCTGEVDRYRLWTEDRLETFVKTKPGANPEGKTITRESSEANPYRCLPFAFAHYCFPVRQFWNGGISDFLRRADLNANVMASELSEAILKHLDPLPFIRNGWPGMRFMIEPQRFIILAGGRMETGKQGLEARDPPEPFYLQAQIDVAGTWEHLRSIALQILKAVGIPQSAVEMEYSAAPSGIMLIINLWPLLQRAKKRRHPFGIYETDLARTILRCAGNYYGMAGLAAEAETGHLTLAWPTPSVPITQDWLDTERSKIEMGLSSVIMSTQAMYGCNREEAIEILEQIKDDQDELARINPAMAQPPPDEEDDEEESDDEDETPEEEPDEIEEEEAEPAASGNGRARK